MEPYISLHFVSILLRIPHVWVEHWQRSRHRDGRSSGRNLRCDLVIDPTQTPVLNRGFRDWNTDFFSQLKANNMSVVCSFSQELGQPPDNLAGGAVWVQRFSDGAAVETATGFGTLNSSQIAFSSGPQNYLGQAFAAMAGLMLAAGLTPKLQFGEILWRFQPSASGMAFYDADTHAAVLRTEIARSARSCTQNFGVKEETASKAGR